MIGERTAEAIKINVGSAFKLEEETTMEVRGKRLGGWTSQKHYHYF